MENFCKTIGLISAGILILALGPSIQPTFAVGFFFDTQINLSNTAADSSTSPQIITDGNNVHAVWMDENSGNFDIFYSNSTDGGNTFATPLNLSNDIGFSTSQKIAVSGNNVYVVWSDNDLGNNEIFLMKSTDGGITFNGGTPGVPGPPINLSNSGVESDLPQLVAVGNNLYVVWVDDSGGVGEIFYTNSTDSGASFGLPVNLSNTTGFSWTPQIAVSGTLVGIVWIDSDSGNDDVYFTKSIDSGLSFNGGTPAIPGQPVNLSNTAGLSKTPQIVASGSNLYVVWNDFVGNEEIYYTRSTDSGTTFNGGTPGLPVNLSGNAGNSQTPQITISGTNVYVEWRDSTPGNDDIFFKSSSNNGATFGSLKNLSSNSGSSIMPKIAVNGSNVYTIWRDATPLNREIFFRSSSDNGATFGGFVNLSGNPEESTQGQLAIIGNNIGVVWENDDGLGFREIFFRAGTPSAIDILYDASEYKISDTAGIEITAPSFDLDGTLAESISVTVSSTSDPVGITVTLTETGANTGIFNGTHTFTAGASSGTSLHADVGDSIVATFNGQTGSAAIFPRIVSFNLEGFLLTSVSQITVSDQNSNNNATLVESISVNVTSDSDPVGISIMLAETGINTGIFTGTHTFTSNPSSGTSLHAEIGDIITATFLGFIDTAEIIPGGSHGGSGGGLVSNPGFVLDFTAGSQSPQLLEILRLIREKGGPVMPSSDQSIDLPFSIDDEGFGLTAFSTEIFTRTKFVDTPIKIKLIAFDVNEVEHAALYTNLRGTHHEIVDSDTYVIYDKGKPLEIVNNMGILSDAKVSFSKTGMKNTFVFELTFAKAMEKSDIIVRLWDSKKNPSDAKILNVWEIVEKNIPLETQIQQQENQILDKPQNDLHSLMKVWIDSESENDGEIILQQIGIEGDGIPSWMKKTAEWVLEEKISDREFFDAITFMKNNKIIE